METTALATTVPDILPWRDLYRQEMHCQIVCDSLHGRPGWTQPYALQVDGARVGYGSVAVGGPWQDKPAVFEVYVLPPYRAHLFELFTALLAASGAAMIQTQTNDAVMTLLLHTFARDIVSEKILFQDGSPTVHQVPGALFRPATADDVPELLRQDLDPEAGWVVLVEGTLAAAGGILFHYNRPYGDIYMKVADPFRRRGLGSYLVQELKRVCSAQGSVPAARCNPANVASRKTLRKAGFVPCGHILTGTVVR